MHSYRCQTPKFLDVRCCKHGWMDGRQLEEVEGDSVEQIYAKHAKSRYFFFTPVTGPRRSFSLKLSDTRDYEPQIRARLGTTAHFC